jgi:hypothetical protein
MTSDHGEHKSPRARPAPLTFRPELAASAVRLVAARFVSQRVNQR